MRHNRESSVTTTLTGTRSDGVDRDADMATSRMDHLQPVETKEWAG